MTITRRHHPLEGKTLEIFSHIHRHGCLQLILVRPDGTRSMVPAHWTDLNAQPGKQAPDGQEHSTPRPETIGSPSDLLRTRTIVDALLRRGDSSAGEEPQAAKEEGGRANGPEIPGDPQADPTGVGEPRR